MDITFTSSPSAMTGTAVACSQCGAVIADWIFDKDGARTPDRPNQDLHKAWHEKIVNDIAQVAFLALTEPL